MADCFSSRDPCNHGLWRCRCYGKGERSDDGCIIWTVYFAGNLYLHPARRRRRLQIHIYTEPKGSAETGVLNLRLWTGVLPLSIAGNGTVIYGSYLGENENVVKSAKNIAVFDTIASMLAALAIIPAMSVGRAALDTAGPGLMFIYLVNVFNGMLAGIMFFYVAGKEYSEKAVNEGAGKPIEPWFVIMGKFIFVPLALIALIAGAILAESANQSARGR